MWRTCDARKKKAFPWSLGGARRAHVEGEWLGKMLWAGRHAMDMPWSSEGRGPMGHPWPGAGPFPASKSVPGSALCSTLVPFFSWDSFSFPK
jgi:hypothetical protein